MAEYDRKGCAVCLLWLQGGKHDEAPTDRSSHLIEPQRGLHVPSLVKNSK